MPASTDVTTFPPRNRGGLCGLAALGLLVAAGLLHLWYLIDHCPLDLSGDEAHYWEWSRRLDWSYYSKGPLVAYIIALGRCLLAGWSERVVGNEALAVRVPAILLSIGTGLGVYTLALRTLGRPRLALGAVALTCTIPVLAAGAMLLTIDAPLAFCYVWALIACVRGLRGPTTAPWLVAGVLIALGFLAKFTMLLIFPVVALAILTEPDFRATLRRAGPYLATLIGLCGLVPIVMWNSQHNWVSLRHVAGQAGVAHRATFSFAGPLEFFAGQAAVVGPIWFGAMICAVVALWRRAEPWAREQHSAAELRLLLYATVVPWAVFLAFSPITKVQPNWPVLSVLPGCIALALWLSRLLRARGSEAHRWGRALVTTGSFVGVATVLLLHFTSVLMPVFAWLARSAPPWSETPVAKYDPTARLRGWSQLGAAVGRQLAAQRAAGRDPFIVTDDYQVASEIAFYCPGEPNVYCLQSVLGDRESQYDLWPNPIRDARRFIGRPCLYVGVRKPELFGGGAFQHAVLRGTRLAETVEHRVRGQLLHAWSVYACDEFAGVPPELLRRLGRKY